LIIAISIVLALYLVCYVIGSTVWLEFDPYRFYRLRPNASAEETFQERTIRIEINSLGFRDREFHIEKPEGTDLLLNECLNSEMNYTPTNRLS